MAFAPQVPLFSLSFVNFWRIYYFVKSKKSKIKTIQPLLVPLPETRIEKCSRAGKAGSASRWKDHIKQPTKIVRVYNEDFDYIARYCNGSDSSFILAFHFLVTFIRQRHGYSAFMCGRQICKSLPS